LTAFEILIITYIILFHFHSQCASGSDPYGRNFSSHAPSSAGSNCSKGKTLKFCTNRIGAKNMLTKWENKAIIGNFRVSLVTMQQLPSI